MPPTVGISSVKHSSALRTNDFKFVEKGGGKQIAKPLKQVGYLPSLLLF